ASRITCSLLWVLIRSARVLAGLRPHHSPRPTHTTHAFGLNPECPPHTGSVRARGDTGMSPLGLPPDCEVVGPLSFRACQRAAGYTVFKMAGVRACGQRCEHQPVAV